MKTQKIGMALAAALAVALQAQAEGWGHHKAVESGRIEELEEQLQALKQELADLKAHQKAHHEEIAELKGAKEQAVSAWPESFMFFRGGYARLMSDRAKDILPSPGTSDANGQNGFYIGAGFEHTLSHDLFGLTEGTLLEGTDLLGEVMFEYKRFAQGKSLLTDSDNAPAPVAPLARGAKQETSTVTEFTITAAPKIKFWRESVVRPWIIPVGFAAHIVSPPSDGVTVFNPGMVFGAGAEVKVWQNIYAGLDFRYHVTPGSESSLSGVEDTDTDGLTAGGYIGFGF